MQYSGLIDMSSSLAVKLMLVTNVGLSCDLGWGGRGLGQMEQGMLDPVQHAEVRDRTDLYKGIGTSLNDPFENFRKNKSHGFVTRMREKAEAVAGSAGTSDDMPVN